MKTDSTWAYDAFGYNRGHLAPSADFRLSKTALSESYYYINMSPQLAAFNRGCLGRSGKRRSWISVKESRYFTSCSNRPHINEWPVGK